MATWTIKPPHSPLSVHKTGWCKKINGKVVKIAGKVEHGEALKKYHIYMAKHLTGQPAVTLTPATATTSVVSREEAAPVRLASRRAVTPASSPTTVSELKDKFVAFKTKRNEEGKMADRSLQSIIEVVNRYAIHYGDRLVSSLTERDFEKYRENLANQYTSPYSLDRHIIQVKAMFKWGALPKYRVIPAIPDWYDSFDGPTDSEITKHQGAVRRKHGARVFTPAEIGKLLGVSDTVERAMVLLGLNCAYGNSDLARLTLNLIDFDKAVIDYPRPKTGAPRQCTLWSETVSALKEAIPARPTPADATDAQLVFLTPTGLPFVSTRHVGGKRTRSDSTTVWFTKLQETAGIYRGQRGLYSLRSTFATIAAEIDEFTARRRIMGHRLPGMDGHYVQNVKDSNLRTVTDYVRQQFEGVIAAPSVDLVRFGEYEHPPLNFD